MLESTPSSSAPATVPALVSSSSAPLPPTYTPSSPYDYLSDKDTLVDAGKGPMTKDMLDAKWKVLVEQMHIRLGDLAPGGLAATSSGGIFKKSTSTKNDGCIVQ